MKDLDKKCNNPCVMLIVFGKANLHKTMFDTNEEVCFVLCNYEGFCVIYFCFVWREGAIGKRQWDSTFLVDVQNNGGQCHCFHLAKDSSQAWGFDMCVLMVGRLMQCMIVSYMWCFCHWWQSNSPYPRKSTNPKFEA